MTTPPSADEDSATMRKLIAKMAEIHAASGEDAPPLLPSVQHGDGLRALLHNRFGKPDDAETMEALHPMADDYDLNHYNQLLHTAAQQLKIPPEQLKALYQRDIARGRQL